jgi:hypothetical protein
MKVRELVNLLRDCDPNAEVVCADLDLSTHPVENVIPADGVVSIG